MATLAEVLAAITALGTSVQSLAAAASGVSASAVTGTVSLSGDRPTVTLSQVAAPRDMVRVSMVITVDEVCQSPAVDYQNAQYGISYSVRRVLQIDTVAAVAADGQTVRCEAINPSFGSLQFTGATMQIAAWQAGTFSKVLPAYFNYVSSTIQLLTRYH